MADDIDAMLSAKAGTDDIDSMLSARASEKPPLPETKQALSRTDRFTQGLTDLTTGLGQAAEHVAENPLNWLRARVREGLNAVGATEASQIFGDVSTKDFDKIVAHREQDYEAKRQASMAPTLSGLITGEREKPGIDWWRLAGNVANPLNYLAPGGGATTTAGRVGAAAAQGAAVGALQPSTSGDFWWDKTKGATVGAAIGAATAGLIQGVSSGLKWGVNAIRAKGAPAGDASQAADTIVNEALKAKGADPSTIDLSIVKAMKDEVDDAIKAGVDPNPAAIANRAEAESLPVPIKLMRGQASRDAMQFAKEQNLRGINNVGEPITTRLTEQNKALIENLNEMGARNAPDPVSTGGVLAEHIKTIDNALQSKIGEAYDAVKNSVGQPAAMDGKAFAEGLKNNLDEEFRFLPAEVRSTIDDLASGNLPLTVKRAQALDKAWSGLQSGAPLNTTTDRALGIAKSSLLEAPLNDSVGSESIAAYKVAKGLAKQRFDLIDANPAYKAVITDAKSAEPDQLFKRFVMGGTSREVSSLQDLVSKVNPNSKELMGRTLMGEIKRQSINGSEEEGALSASKLSKFINDPVWKSRLQTLLPGELLGNLNRLGRVAELIQRPPVASAVNTSNTGSAVVNAVQSGLKAGAMEKLSGLAARIPGISTAMKTTAEGMKQSRLDRAVREALNPGVTTKALPSLTEGQLAAMRAASTALVPAAISAEENQ